MVKAIPKQAAVWDERRNTSAVRPPAPNALRDCLRSMEELRRREPELAQWIAEGAPHLTEAEHVARFGETYEAYRRRRDSRKPQR